MVKQQRRSTAHLTILLLGTWLSLPASVDAQNAPGLKAEIKGIKLSADRRLVVTLKLSDGQGKSVELTELERNSIKFTLASIKEEKNGATSYHNYILTKVSGKEYVFNGED